MGLSHSGRRHRTAEQSTVATGAKGMKHNTYTLSMVHINTYVYTYTRCTFV